MENLLPTDIYNMFIEVDLIEGHRRIIGINVKFIECYIQYIYGNKYH